MATGGREDRRGVPTILKNGTPVPNRIFVGGISPETTDEDLQNLFSKFGNVKSTNILFDKSGVSRGYGFVTFETEEEAQKVLKIQGLTLNQRKLNIDRALKKQPHSRSLESNSLHSSSIAWSAQSYSGNSGFSRDSFYYPQAAWPVWPQQYYLQHQWNYHPGVQSGYPQYWCSVAPMDYPFPSANAVANSDYSETSSVDSAEVTPKSRPNKPTVTASVTSDCGRCVQPKQPSTIQSPNTSRYRGSTSSNCDSPANYLHSAPVHLHPPVFAKTVNGLTVMAYPSSIVMGSPAIVHVRDGANESENVVSELSFLHSPLASGTLTPPQTPLSQLACDLNASASLESLRKN